MSIFNKEFWIIIAIIGLVIHVALNSLKPYGPRGKSDEEKFQHMLKTVGYNDKEDFVLWFSRIVFVAITSKNILHHFKKSDESITTSIIPISSVERVEFSKNYSEKWRGYTWGQVKLYQHNGNIYTISIPIDEIDIFRNKWEQLIS